MIESERENPLEKLVQIAKINHYIWIEHCNSSKESIDKYLLSPVNSNTINDDKSLQGYRTIELSAIAKFFEDIRANFDEEVVFENTLAYSLHGIDAITQDKKGIYTIYEIKGSTIKLRTSRSYLTKTKHKGRQLTKKWCWFSLTDFADFPLTANVFLKTYESFIKENIRRKLVIVSCKKLDDGSYLGKELKIVDFEDINIEDDYSLEKQRNMLNKMNEGVKVE